MLTLWPIRLLLYYRYTLRRFRSRGNADASRVGGTQSRPLAKLVSQHGSTFVTKYGGCFTRLATTQTLAHMQLFSPAWTDSPTQGHTRSRPPNITTRTTLQAPRRSPHK